MDRNVWVRRLVALGGTLYLGCASTPAGPPLYPVKGQVLLDGQPLADAIVTFHPEKQESTVAYGKTDATGFFTLSTYKAGDGVLPGSYSVTVLLQKGDEGINLLPPRYASPKTSGLSADVQPESNELKPFRLRAR